ncbi:unnamed protein product [Sphagnum balticum]
MWATRHNALMCTCRSRQVVGCAVRGVVSCVSASDGNDMPMDERVRPLLLAVAPLSTVALPTLQNAHKYRTYMNATTHLATSSDAYIFKRQSNRVLVRLVDRQLLMMRLR